jgi:carbon monoxide dehydrogenase subunit G
MEKLRLELEINASAEKVFDFLTDPHNIPLVLPGLIENTNIPELPLGAGSQFNYTYQMFGVVLRGDVVIDAIERPSAYHFHTTGEAASTWKQHITPRDGKALFQLEVEYEPPRSWLEKVKLGVMRRFSDKEAEQYLHNLKTVLELQE